MNIKQAKMGEISDEMRRKRARCSKYCPTWNREDGDCEIYGSQYYTPSTCRYFLSAEAERRMRNNG